MDLTNVPTPMLIALVVGGTVQLVCEVVALVVLARTPADRVTLGRRWPWALIIVLVNLIGAVVFLTVGRRPAPVTEPAPPVGRDAAVQAVVEELYPDQEHP